MAIPLQERRRDLSLIDYPPFKRVVVFALVGVVAAFAYGFFKAQSYQIPSTSNPNTLLHGPLADDVKLFVVGWVFALTIGFLGVIIYKRLFEVQNVHRD